MGLLSVSSIVYAHDFKELEVTGFSNLISSIYSLTVSNTTKDKLISCALLDKDGVPIASTISFTSNFVTTVFINYKGDDAVSAKCVLS